MIDYRVSYDQSTGSFVELASGVLEKSYTTSVTLTPGASGTLAALMVTSLENAPKPTAFLA